MSNRRRPRPRQRIQPRRLERWPEPGPDEAYCHQPAVALDRTQDGSVDDARQASHDSLIDQLGPRRRSGIWWTHHYAGEAAQVLADLYPLESMSQHQQIVLESYRAAMENPAAVLVMAWCIGQVPEGVSL